MALDGLEGQVLKLKGEDQASKIGTILCLESPAYPLSCLLSLSVLLNDGRTLVDCAIGWIGSASLEDQAGGVKFAWFL